MNATEEAEYRDFVVARMSTLRRTAYLLSRDWDTADDLVAVALDKLYRHWHRRAGIGDVDAYVRSILTRAWIDETRRPWRREHLNGAAELDQVIDGNPSPGAEDVAGRLTLDGYLAGLDRRHRAVLVLRFYCDMSIRETADILGLSIGTVKSQTARALAALRDRTIDQSLIGRE